MNFDRQWQGVFLAGVFHSGTVPPNMNCVKEGRGFIAADRRARDNGWGAGARAIGVAKSGQKKRELQGRRGEEGEGGVEMR